MKKLTSMLLAAILLVNSNTAFAQTREARDVLQKRREEITAKELAVKENQQKLRLQLERDSADYKMFYDFYIGEGFSKDEAEDKAASDLKKSKRNAFFNSVGDKAGDVWAHITLQDRDAGERQGILIFESIPIGGAFLWALSDFARFSKITPLIGADWFDSGWKLHLRGTAATKNKLFFTLGGVLVIAAQILFSSSVEYSYFNQPVVTMDERVAMLEEKPSLFANPGATETDVHTWNLQQMFLKHPYMEKYMDDYITVTAIASKYSIIPFEEINNEFAVLPKEQQKNSSYFAIAAKHLVPFDKAASVAMKAKFAEDSKNFKPFEAEIPVIAQDNLKVKGQNVYKAEKILFQK